MADFADETLVREHLLASGYRVAADPPLVAGHARVWRCPNAVLKESSSAGAVLKEFSSAGAERARREIRALEALLKRRSHDPNLAFLAHLTPARAKGYTFTIEGAPLWLLPIHDAGPLTLKDMHSRLDDAEVVRVFAQVARALLAVHAARWFTRTCPGRTS